jgi:hypothetical protein
VLARASGSNVDPLLAKKYSVENLGGLLHVSRRIKIREERGNFLRVPVKPGEYGC